MTQTTYSNQDSEKATRTVEALYGAQYNFLSEASAMPLHFAAPIDKPSILANDPDAGSVIKTASSLNGAPDQI